MAHRLALEGDERLSGTNKADRRGNHSGEAKRRPRRDSTATVGQTLRSIYDDILREDVPKDFLDLLQKLD